MSRWIFLPLLAGLVSIFSNTYSQQTFKTTSNSVIGYLEYLPPDYHSNLNKYPIVIFLHGIGERGANSTDPATLQNSISTVTRNGPPLHVKQGTQFPFILISPQLKDNYGDWPSWYVMEVVNHVKAHLRVDESRIYLTGLSLGGGGTWWTAQDNPGVFAAIAPVCGSRNLTSKACLLAAENLPVWAFHGDADNVVALSRSVNMVNAINNCQPAPDPLAKLTIYPGVKHDAWVKAYKPDHSVHNPNVYDWLMAQRKGTSAARPSNILPKANAGADKSISLPLASVIVTGSGSDADGTIVSYSWSKVSGGPIIMSGTTSRKMTLTSLLAGVYTFRLTVTDNSGDTASDDVKVSVTSLLNQPPVADAGGDKSITLPDNDTYLTGSGQDVDGTIASYTWTKTTGGAATMNDTNTPTLSLTNLTQGDYTFKLTVTDNDGAIASDQVTLTVNPNAGGGNQSPVVNAGVDKTITLPANSINLNATASDPDGTVVKYWWEYVSGGKGKMAGITSNTLRLSELEKGTYVYRLTVTDDKGAQSYDDVSVTVAKVGNVTPVVNAGPNLTITLPVNHVDVDGAVADPDGSITYLLWEQVSGPRCVLASITSPTLKLSEMEPGTYLYRLTVRDDDNAEAHDDVTIVVLSGSVAAGGGGANLRTGTGSPANDGMITHDTEDIATMLEENGHIDLARATAEQLTNYTVIVLDEQGNRIYSGPWKEDSFITIFSSRGLYFYHVVREGKRVDSGKILIRN